MLPYTLYASSNAFSRSLSCSPTLAHVTCCKTLLVKLDADTAAVVNHVFAPRPTLVYLVVPRGAAQSIAGEDIAALPRDAALRAATTTLAPLAYCGPSSNSADAAASSLGSSATAGGLIVAVVILALLLTATLRAIVARRRLGPSQHERSGRLVVLGAKESARNNMWALDWDAEDGLESAPLSHTTRFEEDGISPHHTARPSLQVTAIGAQYKAVAAHTPRYHDELALAKGDVVKLTAADDGGAFLAVLHLGSNVRGLVPRSVLRLQAVSHNGWV